jgi:hypothetical protein
LGHGRGESEYDTYEEKLAKSPEITVPTITMQGDANGALHPDPAVHAKMFIAKYEHRNVGRGIGYILPQEAPQAFEQAILDVDKF